MELAHSASQTDNQKIAKLERNVLQMSDITANSEKQNKNIKETAEKRPEEISFRSEKGGFSLSKKEKKRKKKTQKKGKE